MFLTGSGHRPLPGFRCTRFSRDLKGALAFQHDVDLVLFAVNMTLLFLPRFEAIDVAEEPWRFNRLFFFIFSWLNC